MKIILHVSASMLIAIALFVSCHKKDSESLPDAYIGGSEVFACKINGKPYVASGTAGSLAGAGDDIIENGILAEGVPDYALLDSTGIIKEIKDIPYLWMLGGGYKQDDIILYLFPLKDTGMYIFNQNIPCPYPTCLENLRDTTAHRYYASQGSKYFTSATQQGWVHLARWIKGDSNHADGLLGTFAFKAQDAQGDTINVTDGRFYLPSKKIM